MRVVAADDDDDDGGGGDDDDDGDDNGGQGSPFLYIPTADRTLQRLLPGNDNLR